jgi:hypothetical protein
MPQDINNAADTEDHKPKELKVLYSWQAPIRPFKRKDRQFWTTVGSIVFLIGLILIFIQEFLLIAAIIALTFVYYVLSTVEPEMAEFKLTNRGLYYVGTNYDWESINQFWFSNKGDQRMVNFQLKSIGLTSRISILIGDGNEKTIKEILLKYLVEEEIKPGFMDKAADWVQKKVPLEEEKKQ